MIDKIIEELEENAFEVDTRDYGRLDVVDVECAIEIVKKYENNGWISVKDRLPANEDTLFNQTDYLTYNKYGITQVLPYYYGWNCGHNKDGSVYRESEIKDIIYWKEIELPQKLKELSNE